MLPETRGNIILKAKVQKLAASNPTSLLNLRVSSTDVTMIIQLVGNGIIRPTKLFFTQPVVFFFALWVALAVGNIFLASQSIAQIYSTNYDFSFARSGYLETALLIGEIIGIPICLWQNRIWAASSFRNDTNKCGPVPESRLELSIPCSFLGMAGGLFVYGWTCWPEIHWVVPAIGLAMCGLGIMVVGYCAVIYLTDAYGIWSGSAIAAVASIENLFSAFLPLSAQSMYTNLGFQWASTLLGFIAVALSIAPIVLYFKGQSIRARSKYMRSE